MVVPLAARVLPLTRAPNCRGAIIAIAIAIAAVALGCRRDAKKPVQLHTVEGESAVLPRLARIEPAPMVVSPHVLAVGTRQRRWVLVEPTAPAPGRALILVLHGDGGDASGLHEAWPFEKATGDQAVLAYPDGEGRTWDLETKGANKDIAFLEWLVGEVARSHAIDRSRVFATGYSSGGFMVNVLACHRPGLLRAIASNAGGAPYHQAETWTNGFPKCPGQGPVATLALHGERDGSVDLDSGRFSAEYWAYVNGCQTDAMDTTGYEECHAYRGCPAGRAVGFCVVPRLGHWVWDRSAEVSWTFFQRQ